MKIKKVEELSENYQTVVPNYQMPAEFAEISASSDPSIVKGIQKANEKSGSKPFSFYTHMVNYLSRSFQGPGLPKDLYSLAGVFKYEKAAKDLFIMEESEYKAKHKDYYDTFFNNLSYNDKKVVFQCADYGLRTVFELERDTLASNILEHMICHYSRGYLTVNEGASSIGKKISTAADIIFRSIKYPDIWTYVELKTRWSSNNINKVSFRGSGYERLKKDGCVAISMTMSSSDHKAVVVDAASALVAGKSIEGVKEYSDVYVPKEDIIPFKFWEWKDMREILIKIYSICSTKDKKNDIEELNK